MESAAKRQLPVTIVSKYKQQILNSFRFPHSQQSAQPTVVSSGPCKSAIPHKCEYLFHKTLSATAGVYVNFHKIMLNATILSVPHRKPTLTYQEILFLTCYSKRWSCLSSLGQQFFLSNYVLLLSNYVLFSQFSDFWSNRLFYVYIVFVILGIHSKLLIY